MSGQTDWQENYLREYERLHGVRLRFEPRGAGWYRLYQWDVPVSSSVRQGTILFLTSHLKQR